MGLIIAAALLAPLLLVLRRRQFEIDLPKALIITIAATLLATTLVLRLMLANVEDPSVFILILFVGAPCIAVPVATIAASSLVRVRGYGIAAALTGFAGWVLGMIVLLVIASMQTAVHGLFTDLLIILAIPASYSATCSVYAVALGKRRT